MLRPGQEIYSLCWYRPWLVKINDVDLVCLVCPIAGTWVHTPRTRNGWARAIRMHSHCGHML